MKTRLASSKYFKKMFFHSLLFHQIHDQVSVGSHYLFFSMTNSFEIIEDLEVCWCCNGMKLKNLSGAVYFVCGRNLDTQRPASFDKLVSTMTPN